MIGKLFKRKRENRFERMSEKIPLLSDSDLKEWYIGADTQRIIGDACEHELSLLSKIEKELNSRGFEYMVDY